MKTWVDTLITEYYKFLQDKTEAITDTGTDWAVISTPFISAFNDCIEIYARKQDETIFLSDDGITLKNLNLQGVYINNSTKRQEMFDRILLTYGVEINGSELITKAHVSNFAQKKHNFLTAISEINDMHMLSGESVISMFNDDIKLFFNENEIIYTAGFRSKGKTGLEFNFDFQIAHADKEIIIESFNSIDRPNMTKFLFALDDVRSIREQISGKDLVGLAIVNDAQKVNPDYIDALKSRNVEFILWTKRDNPDNLQKLAA